MKSRQILEILALGALLLLGTLPASAGPVSVDDVDGDDKGWFYNRPGVSMADFEKDFAHCRAFAAGSIGQAVNGGLVGAALFSAASAGTSNAYMDDCMVAAGYRRFDIAGTTIRAFNTRFAAMNEASRLALVSSETPAEGVLSRSWDNALWFAKDSDAPQAPTPPGKPTNWGYTLKQLKSAPAGRAMTLAPDQSVVVLSTLHVLTDDAKGRKAGNASLGLVLIDPATGKPVETMIGKKMDNAGISLDADADGNTKAFVVPSGTYSLFMMWPMPGVKIHLCLAAPAFRIAPGESLDLGTITVRSTGKRFGPLGQLRIDPANSEVSRSVLAGSPDLAAKLKPGVWMNGLRPACPAPNFTVIYGVAIPGAAQYAVSAQ